MKPSIFKVVEVSRGVLFVMPKPSSDYLIDDLLYYKDLGVDVLVSLLEANEAWELGLANEADRASEIGLTFFNFPIKDRAVPTASLMKEMLSAVTSNLDSGKCVALHCRAGIGRSGLAACCVLMQYGYQSDDAMSLVSSARGISIPDTSAQIDFIYDFEHNNPTVS